MFVGMCDGLLSRREEPHPRSGHQTLCTVVALDTEMCLSSQDSQPRFRGKEERSIQNESHIRAVAPELHRARRKAKQEER